MRLWSVVCTTTVEVSLCLPVGPTHCRAIPEIGTPLDRETLYAPLYRLIMGRKASAHDERAFVRDSHSLSQ